MVEKSTEQHVPLYSDHRTNHVWMSEADRIAIYLDFPFSQHMGMRTSPCFAKGWSCTDAVLTTGPTEMGYLWDQKPVMGIYLAEWKIDALSWIIAEMLGHFGLPLLTRHIEWRRPLTSSRDLPSTTLVESHSLGWVPDLLPNFGHEIGKKIPLDSHQK